MKQRNSESGFAVLFVYAMAATVAIMLYMELPRVAFEAQRDKEQLLIDRGEQYTRAVTLYVRKFNKFPADFDALQSTQNLRFLRHKYIDPMTGKDDWRIVHVGPGGVFTDSLVYGKKDDKKKADQQNFITELQQTGGNQISVGQQGVNIGTRQRLSDQPGLPGDPNNPNPTPPASLPQPGLFQPGIPQFDANGQPIPNPVNGMPQPAVPGQFQPGANGFPGGLPGQPFPGGAPGQPFPGGPPGVQQPGQISATNLINQILTTPRPGGLNGFGGIQQAAVDQNGNPLPNAPGANMAAITTANLSAPPAAAQAQVIGGGIAGVASKLELDGIKTYKDQTSYNKWEFVYDITKDPSRSAIAQLPPAAPAAPNSPAPANAPTPNTPIPNMPTLPPALPAIPTPPQ